MIRRASLTGAVRRIFAADIATFVVRSPWAGLRGFSKVGTIESSGRPNERRQDSIRSLRYRLMAVSQVAASGGISWEPHPEPVPPRHPPRVFPARKIFGPAYERYGPQRRRNRAESTACASGLRCATR